MPVPEKTVLILDHERDIMASLKRHTADAHKQVESLMPFFTEELSVETYTATLRAFLGFFEPVERKLAVIPAWETVPIDLATRRRAHLLRADMRALGMPESEISATPECRDLPATGNCAAGLGCLYVLEGSTLGGQLIAREMERRFGLDRHSGASFFSSHGKDVGAMWKEFCRAVRSYVNTPDRRAAAVNAATQTFHSFESWMRKASGSGE